MARRVVISVMALAFLAGACGGDSSDDAGDGSVFLDADSSASSDDSGGSDDSGSSDDSGGSGGSATPTSFDCNEVRDALERAGDSVDFDPSASADDLQASFDQSRAQLQALADEAPELSDDIDTALEGLDAIGAAFEAIGWDPNSLATNPEAALEFASLLNDSSVMAMTQALSSISTWVATACG